MDIDETNLTLSGGKTYRTRLRPNKLSRKLKQTFLPLKNSKLHAELTTYSGRKSWGSTDFLFSVITGSQSGVWYGHIQSLPSLEIVWALMNFTCWLLCVKASEHNSFCVLLLEQLCKGCCIIIYCHFLILSFIKVRTAFFKGVVCRLRLLLPTGCSHLDEPGGA